MIHLRNYRVFSFFHLLSFYVGLFFVIFPLTSGCREENKKTNANTAQPQIKFEQISYDFGEVSPGDTVEHIFKFKNVGRGPLKIKKVETSCACTATLLAEDTIPPNGTGQIKAVFKTSNAGQGPVGAELIVHSDDPSTPVISLKLTGITKVFVACFPPRLYFASVKRGESPIRSFKIWDTAGNHLRIEKVETSSKWLDAQVTGSERVSGSINYMVNVRLSPQIAPGKFAEVVTVYTNHPQKTKIEIPVEAHIVGRIKIWPERLFIGMVKRGQTVIRKIEIDAKVEKVESSSEFIKASLVKNNGNGTYQVRIKVDDATPTGILREKLIIHTNSQEEPFIEIDLFGFVKAS